MAYLNLNAIEPVDFGGRECTPRIDTETKMRLSLIKKYDKSAQEALTSAFPDDEEYVKDFVSRMATMDMQMLHAYLLGGPTMVEAIQNKIKNVVEEAEKSADEEAEEAEKQEAENND